MKNINLIRIRVYEFILATLANMTMKFIIKEEIIFALATLMMTFFSNYQFCIYMIFVLVQKVAIILIRSVFLNILIFLINVDENEFEIRVLEIL